MGNEESKLSKTSINWFPGHMKKTLAEIKEKLKNIDVVLYVLDSRAPVSSINPNLNNLCQDKNILYIFNKIDMANEERVKIIAKNYKTTNSDYCLLNSTSSGQIKIIKQKILSLASKKIEKMKNKGFKAVVRAIVVGVPNSGKSTLVNNLCGKSKAITGDRAGVTKSTQWVSIGDNIELCDTPGTLYPNLENQSTAEKLYFIGSIKDEVIADKISLAEHLLNILNKLDSSAVEKRFGKDLRLESIALKRGYFLNKAELDIERVANAIVDDFRKGRIGKFTLD